MLLKKVIVPGFDFYLSGFCIAHFMTRKLSMVVLQYSSVAPKDAGYVSRAWAHAELAMLLKLFSTPV